MQIYFFQLVSRPKFELLLQSIITAFIITTYYFDNSSLALQITIITIFKK